MARRPPVLPLFGADPAAQRSKPKAKKEPKKKAPARPLVLAPRREPTVFERPAIDRPGAGIQRAQRLAESREEAVRRRMPQRPIPHIPTLRRYTPAQQQAARELLTRERRRQAGVQPGDPGFAEALENVDREWMRDPRTRARLELFQRVARGQANDIADTIARSRGVRGTRAERIRAGNALIAQTMLNNRVREGRPDSRVGFGPASVNLSGVQRALKAATTLDQAPSGARQFVGGAISDVGTIATAPFVGAVEVGRGGYEAIARGDTRRLEALAKGTVQGVSESALGRLVQGDFGGALEQFRTHPVLSGLDVAAAGAIAGRGAGALARGAGSTSSRSGVRRSLGRAGSTVRPPLALSDDLTPGGLVERTYSKDSTRKAAQVLADGRREPLRDAQGNVVTVEQRGRQVPVLKASPRERERLNRGRADFTASRANLLERMVRAEAGHETKVRGVKGRAARDMVAMTIEGTVTSGRHFVDDLRAHRDRLQAEYERRIAGDGEFRHTAEAKANRDRVALVEKVLESPRATRQAEQIVQVAERHARALNARERQLIAAGVLDADSARRSKLIPAAIEHMGARFVSVAEHRRMERDALKVERQARRAFQGAKTAAEREAASRALVAARQQRIAVSGRNPAEVEALERAVALFRGAREQHRRAQAEVAKLERSRQRLIGAAQVQRGPEAARRMAAAQASGNRGQAVVRYIDGALDDPQALARGAARERQREKVRAKVEQRLATARAAERKARADRDAARTALQGVRRPQVHAAVRRADGRFLSNEEIEAFLRERGRDPETIAYLPHRQDVRGARAFHARLRPGTRPNLDQERRTGSAYAKGATEVSAQLVREHGVRQAVQLVKAEQLDRLVTDTGLRHPAWAKAQRGETLTPVEKRIVDRGGYFTAKEAAEIAQRLENDAGERLVPVRAFGAKLSRETQALLRENQDPAAFETLDARLLSDRVLKPGELDGGARNIVLVPAELIERLERHLTPAGSILRGLQLLNRPFRMAVLPQPKWLTGNFVEPFLIRLPLAGSGVVNLPGLAVDLAAARKVLRRMERSGDPAMVAAAKELRAQQLGGLLIGNRGASVRRQARDVGGPLGSPLALASVVRELPVVKQMTDFALLPINTMFNASRVMEGVAQQASLGKSIRRDVAEFRQSWLRSIRLGKRAADEAAKGLLNTPTQQRFMKAQHRLLGQYDGFPPVLRELVQSVAPFLPWALNAGRFVFWTMPAHNTTTTATLVHVSQVFEDEWQREHADAPPGDLEHALRTRDGGFVDLARYSPWGIVTSGDAATLVEQFVPQLSGAAAALKGQDPFGRPLRVQPDEGNPTGEPTLLDELAIAGNSLLEGLVPYVGNVRRLREGGGTGYADSNILSPKTKPGTTHMSGARRTLDPFRPTYLRGGPQRQEAVTRRSGGFDPDTFVREALRETAPAAAPTAGFDAERFVREALAGR